MSKFGQLKKLPNIWKRLTSGSINRQIFGAAVTVAAMTALVKVAAMVKELVVAWKFGTGDDLDAFLIAWLVPSFVINVVSGSFNAALIPTYIRVREQEGAAAAQKLFSGVILWSLGLLAIATVLIIITAPLYLPLIAKGFNPAKLELTFRLLCGITPVIFLSGIAVIWGAVLNAGERFALAALLPILTPTVSVIFLLLDKSWGVYALVAGLLCGAALEMTFLGVALKRQGMALRPKWYGFDAHLRQVAGQYAPMIAGSFLMSSTSLVDQSMAAMLSPGSVAALNYGSRVIALPLGLGATALGTAVIPYFSRMVACQDWAKLHHTLNQYLKLIFICTVPLTVFIVIISEPLVKVLFQRGAFNPDDTYVVSRIQAFYSMQIPFYVAGIMGARLLSSLLINTLLFKTAILNFLLNVILNIVFLRILGISGIALSTSIVYLMSCSTIYMSLTKIIFSKLKQSNN